LLTPYAPPIPGGISSFVSGLAKGLRGHGHQVVELVGLGQGSTAKTSNLGAGRRYVALARKTLDEVRPEIVHCHAHWYTLAAGVSYLRRNPKAHLVFSFHTTTVPRWERSFTRLLNRANVITFVSGAQLAEIRKRLRIAVDMRILRPATELATVDPEVQREFARKHLLSNRFPVLAFAGPLEYPMKVKGVIDLVSSLQRVRAVFPRVKLLIIGDGSLRDRVASVASGFGDAVEITGFLPDPRPAVSLADVYCHSSYQEGLPLALLEAMALGRCVLAYPAGGIPEVLDGTNGFLVDAGAEAIGLAISRLAGDVDIRSRAGNAARETVAKWYTWEARFPQVNSIYGLA